jgi:hypothetical protein
MARGIAAGTPHPQSLGSKARHISRIDRREVNLQNNTLIESEGRSLGEILELPEGWPE